MEEGKGGGRKVRRDGKERGGGEEEDVERVRRRVGNGGMETERGGSGKEGTGRERKGESKGRWVGWEERSKRRYHPVKVSGGIRMGEKSLVS